MRAAAPYLKFSIGAGLAVAAAALFWFISTGPDGRAPSNEVAEPALSGRATRGKALFGANCATCHGERGAGTDKGPPLIHDFYNPGHHADAAFFAAAKFGVRQHHWHFGNMPPQPQVGEEELAAIVDYVREVQVANGITFRPHRM
ncbi:cytochrome c [Bradyrhizobium sp. BTAi1]|uniref:c-type cytochrome n=1 Tax=Bradyrhizobium sp. (strain BTAi1 / ATCC BAA-1182) TaxID=288000 RepID=UPI0001519B61|nr:cytochrome c [Bradyrhizobium sp. BTAi1]ABQ39785.1 putative cytochrome c, class I precursor [Bradyrhizobium sp. BTAi1]